MANMAMPSSWLYSLLRHSCSVGGDDYVWDICLREMFFVPNPMSVPIFMERKIVGIDIYA